MAIIEEGNTINISLNQDDVGRVLAKIEETKEGKNDENTNSQTGQAS